MLCFAGCRTELTCYLVSAAEEVLAECPWYLEMRNLIGKRPSATPTGIGNSDTPIELGILGTGTNESQLRDTTSDFESSEGVGGQEEDELNELDELEDEAALSDASLEDQDAGLSSEGKKSARSASTTTTHALSRSSKRTAPQPSNSKRANPSTPSTGKSAKKTKFDDFATIAAAEEQTEQKKIELERMRLSEKSQRMRLHAEKIARREAREVRRDERDLRKMELRTEVKLLTLKQQHELDMARLYGGNIPAAPLGMLSTAPLEPEPQIPLHMWPTAPGTHPFDFAEPEPAAGPSS